MSKVEYQFDDSFKETIRKDFETELSKWNKQKEDMTSEEIAEVIAEDEKRIAALEASIAADDPEGHFKNMTESMHDPENPLYKTYTHPNEDEGSEEEEEYIVDPDDELIIDEYKQYVFLEGVSPEEALRLLNVEKVTDQIVIWGEEDKEERKELQKVIDYFGDKVTDPYTQEEKAERAKEIKEMEAQGISWKGNAGNADSPSTERAVFISNLLDFIDVDELPVEKEDAFMNTYESLPDEERKVLDLRLAGKPLRECGEIIGKSHESARKIESKAIEALRSICYN